MAQTRAKSNLASVHERITAFNNKFRNPEALKQLGWEDVPIVDVKCSSSWIEATNEIASGGYSHYIINDWVNKPIALANHRLFQFDNNFVNTLSEINNEIEFTEQIDNYFHVPSNIIFKMVENLEFTRSYIVQILILINFPGVTVCQ